MPPLIQLSLRSGPINYNALDVDRASAVCVAMTVHNAIWEKLRRSIEGEVRADSASLALYASDASTYRQVPLGVVVPRHEADVMHVLAIARENRLPILARGPGPHSRPDRHHRAHERRIRAR